jgi:ergothioneine biosynthesis protein EgtB
MSLLIAYQITRKASQEMCRPLLTEDYIPQPIEYVSPPKWNLAHTSWFFEEFILKPHMDGYRQMHPLYNHLFNSYYEGAGKRAQRNSRGNLSRPSVQEVYSYRQHVDVQMRLLLSGEISKEIADLVVLGINHEQQHQELFYCDLKYTFSLNPLNPAYGSRAFCEEGNSGEGKLLTVSEGIYDLGHDAEGFSFDNERPNHKVYLQNYQISDSLVSNGSYLKFIREGGYANHNFWHEEGWSWVNENRVTKPMYWFDKEGQWHQHTLAGPRRLDPTHPVTHINYYEASAYAAWKGMRLPTEFEWEAASDLFKWGKRWEWTESAYLPYPGFQKAEGTVGEYNGKFMVNQKVLRGGSVVSPPGHVRKSYRNFFHPHLGWQYTGIRLAK